MYSMMLSLILRDNRHDSAAVLYTVTFSNTKHVIKIKKLWYIFIDYECAFGTVYTEAF